MSRPSPGESLQDRDAVPSTPGGGVDIRTGKVVDETGDHLRHHDWPVEFHCFDPTSSGYLTSKRQTLRRLGQPRLGRAQIGIPGFRLPELELPPGSRNDHPVGDSRTVEKSFG